MADQLKVYRAIWARAQAAGVVVRYDPSPGCADGAFDAHYNPSTGEFAPELWIARRNAMGETADPEGSPDLLAELITLAHEYGHLRSWSDATPRHEWLVYAESLARFNHFLSEVEQSFENVAPRERLVRIRLALRESQQVGDSDEILREEARAWTLGAAALREFGFEEWKAYINRKQSGLQQYCLRLGAALPPALADLPP